MKLGSLWQYASCCFLLGSFLSLGTLSAQLFPPPNPTPIKDSLEPKHRAPDPGVNEKEKQAGFETSESKNLDRTFSNKMVYGWHPHWMERDTYNFDYNILSHLSYFSYEINPRNGHIKNEDDFLWKETKSIDSAKLLGLRVDLCANLFGNRNIKTFLGSPTAKQNFISNVIWLLKLRSADGLNIDFELMPSSMREPFVLFIADLYTQLKAELPWAELSMDLPAVDWNSAFDIQGLEPHMDYFMLMGYDYYYAGSKNAGPTAPIYSTDRWGRHSLKRSIQSYLNKGLPSDKFVLGLPYYGRRYLTHSDTFQAPVKDYIGSITYKRVKEELEGFYPIQIDPYSGSAYSIFGSDTGWHQYWFETEKSLAPKLNLVHEYNLKGMAIWALGYDNGYDQFWMELHKAFGKPQSALVGGLMYDTGGPLGDYLANASDIWTLKSPTGNRVRLQFNHFSTETGKDVLEIFDGPDARSPLIGRYSGWTVQIPDLLSSGPEVTFVFTSDASTQSLGWEINWESLNLDIQPIETITELELFDGWGDPPTVP